VEVSSERLSSQISPRHEYFASWKRGNLKKHGPPKFEVAIRPCIPLTVWTVYPGFQSGDASINAPPCGNGWAWSFKRLVERWVERSGSPVYGRRPRFSSHF